MRQSDVEDVSGVDQTTASLVERGALGGLTVGVIRTVGDAVGVQLEFEPRLRRGGDVPRLLDRGHAALVELVIRILRRIGWEVVAEYTFNHYGDRGSVDIVAWHAASRTLLLVEVNTRLVDVQELLASFDRKCRVVPNLLARERGWGPSGVARLVVVEDQSTARRVVAQHEQTFVAALPMRAREVRRWLSAPSGSIAGLWFLSSTTGGRTKRDSASLQRVRKPRPRSAERGG